jgi:hypothetical protein
MTLKSADMYHSKQFGFDMNLDVMKKCNNCGRSPPDVSFSGTRKTCTSCRNQQAKVNNAKKVAALPDHQLCSGCNTAKPIESFQGLKSCTGCREKGKRSDARPERREYHNAMNRNKKYYEKYRQKMREIDETAYLAHLASKQRVTGTIPTQNGEQSGEKLHLVADYPRSNQEPNIHFHLRMWKRRI